jgi:hypothetical protein
MEFNWAHAVAGARQLSANPSAIVEGCHPERQLGRVANIVMAQTFMASAIVRTVIPAF